MSQKLEIQSLTWLWSIGGLLRDDANVSINKVKIHQNLTEAKYGIH